MLNKKIDKLNYRSVLKVTRYFQKQDDLSYNRRFINELFIKLQVNLDTAIEHFTV